MPGSPPLVAPAASQPLLPRLARAAGALAVLAFGLALVLAPGQVLGNLLSTNAESIAGGVRSRVTYDTLVSAGVCQETPARCCCGLLLPGCFCSVPHLLLRTTFNIYFVLCCRCCCPAAAAAPRRHA
jgi:hypothetical protein